ncbi:hypothetical protein EC973_004565 [Apophysomyces ossiformis]|uniref:Zn(2)-C6 fungal-type domain-containing protein n=1 Tax=Apophysomyces ossiformis TaxID=679940 RepID=A0A8H7BSS1_9FUNG|nr:hypothetical protein EC973_004565 [Apophysomyces ossiformis]
MSNSGDDAAARRQRVSRACDLCRRKKIKCDGLSPICSNCQAFSLECSYNDTTKKRGPPKGYIEAIENRLHRLENFLGELAKEDNPRSQALLAELNSPLETSTGEQIKTRPVRRADRQKSPYARRQNSGKSKVNLQIETQSDASGTSSAYLVTSPTLAQPPPSSPDSVDDSTGQLSMDETGQVRYLGKSSGYYLLQDSRTYQNGAFHFSGWGHRSSSDTNRKQFLSSSNPLELPPSDLSDHLLKLYFDNFYPFLPMFYKRQLNSTFASPEEPVSPLLLNAIYALASRLSPDKRVRSDPDSPDTAGDIFFERAKRLLDDYYDIPKISTVQALLLLSCHQHGVMKAARAWLYSGMAFRMAQDLGLNRNCEQWDIPPPERQRRKRVFWCCFIVDRLTSAIFGRSSNFEERDIDIPFPSMDDDEEVKAGNESDSTRPPVKIVESFIHLIKLCDILGHVLKNIYYAKARYHGPSHHINHILTTLNRQLTNWYNNLPPSLQYKLPNTQLGETGPDPPLPICQMHMIYYTTVILLHRPFIPGPTQSRLPMSLPSFKICISAAYSILDIVNIMVGENHLKYVFAYTVYYVFTAGIIFIKLASSPDAEQAFDAKVNVNKIMRALDEIEVTWTNAARSCNILGELAGLRDINLECNEYVPQPVSKEVNSPPPSIAVPNSPELVHKSEPRQKSEKAYQGSSNSEIAVREMQDVAPVQRIDYTMVSEKFPFVSSSESTSGSQYGFIPMSDTPSMDPFAAPGTIRGPSQRQFDPLGTAFWGVPSSLDTEEWNNYFAHGVLNQPYQSTNIQANQPLISSEDGMHSISYLTERKQSSGDQQNDILCNQTSSSLPGSPSRSVLLGFQNPLPTDTAADGQIRLPRQTTSALARSSELPYW